MTDRIRVQVFIGIIGIILIGLLYSNIMGNKQNEEFKKDYLLYQSSLTMLQENQGVEAKKVLTTLAEKYPNQYIISRYAGLAYAMIGENQAAETYYQKAIDQRPFLQVDPMFILQFGEIAYFNENYAKAKAYLVESKRYSANKQYFQNIDGKLADIELKINNVDSKDEDA